MMPHDFAGPSIQVKFQEAVPLMRIISGSDQNLHIERKWMEVALRELAPDGLAYIPVVGRPWYARLNPAPSDLQLQDGQLLSPFYCGRLLSTMAVLAQRDRSPLWREAARKLAEGVVDLAIDAGEMAYFWLGP